VIAFRPSLQAQLPKKTSSWAPDEILGRSSSNRHKEGPQRSSSSCAARTPPDAAMDPVIDEVKVLRDVFRGKESSIIQTEIQVKTTLGQGHFGRVRVIEAPLARDELKKKYEMFHTGLFALKIMKKSEIMRLKQYTHVHDERKLLSRLKNPFIVTPYHTYQDERNLYMIMEYIQGGEIGSKLHRDETFSNDLARFYIAQLVMVLQYMHTEHVIYRSVGTTDILVDSMGYIKLVDFGFAKYLPPKEDEENKTFTLCGTPEYLAPEIINNKGHSKGVDWWATGILIYEMLAGYPPFYAPDPFDIYTKILKGFDAVRTPAAFDEQATSLIKKMLHLDVTKRLGCSAGGAEDIKRHKWFRGLDWAALYNKQLDAPWKPTLADDSDTSHFSSYDDSIEESGPQLPPEVQDRFAYWEAQMA
jgi:serine/threonine protein kinase